MYNSKMSVYNGKMPLYNSKNYGNPSRVRAALDDTTSAGSDRSAGSAGVSPTIASCTQSGTFCIENIDLRFVILCIRKM